jgi:hypothetical protein
LPRDLQELSSADFDAGNVAAKTAQQILMRYDYARAKVLLDTLGKDVMDSGPYLISRIAGLAGERALRVFLNMSHVTADLVWDWTRTFCWLAAQERSWSEITLQRFALNTRNAIAIAAKNMPEVKDAVQQWIRVVEAK